MALNLQKDGTILDTTTGKIYPDMKTAIAQGANTMGSTPMGAPEDVDIAQGGSNPGTFATNVGGGAAWDPSHGFSVGQDSQGHPLYQDAGGKALNGATGSIAATAFGGSFKPSTGTVQPLNHGVSVTTPGAPGGTVPNDPFHVFPAAAPGGTTGGATFTGLNGPVGVTTDVNGNPFGSQKFTPQIGGTPGSGQGPGTVPTGMDPNYITDEQARLRAMGLDTQNQFSQLGAETGAREAVEGPSAAQAQLQSATNTGMHNLLALAGSGRGYGQDASALSQAIGQEPALAANAANASANLRAQENAAWRQRQLDADKQRAMDLSLGTTAAMTGEQGGVDLGKFVTGDATQRYGIDKGVGVANDQLAASKQGALIGAGGMGLAALLGLSDENQKNKGPEIKVASNFTGNPYGSTGAPGLEENPYDASLRGPGRPNEGKGTALHKPQDPRTQRLAGGIAEIAKMWGAPGPGLQTPGAGVQAPGPRMAPNPYAGPLLSDESSKNKIAELTSMNDALRASLGGAPATAGVPKRDVDTAALDAATARAPDFSKAPAYAYTYKDPTLPGAAPGVQAGPMAQDLEKAGSRAVLPTPIGKMVDPTRLTMENSSAIGENQDSIEFLKKKDAEKDQMIAALASAMGQR